MSPAPVADDERRPKPLPLAPAEGGLGPVERIDAARNRRRILAAAAALVDAHGIEHVSMQDVARAAEVGTGTLYRRFGDRAGLAVALLDEHTRRFQDAMLSGPPPLGPGAPAAERLKAFGDGWLDLLERHGRLMAAGLVPGRETAGPHTFYVTHLAILLREAAPHLDAEYTAQVLLAALGPGAHAYRRSELGWPLERLRAGWHALVDGLASPIVVGASLEQPARATAVSGPRVGRAARRRGTGARRS